MKFETIATGFGLAEAPHADSRGVWFTDMAVGGVRCLRPDGHLDVWLAERKTIGGLAFNNDGRILCSGSDGIIWLDPQSGRTGTLLGELNGRPIDGINDMMADGRGGLFFGTVDHPNMFAGLPMRPSALCHLAANGRLRVLREGIRFANGFGLSPDGERLYHNDSSVGTRTYRIAPDSSLSADVFLRQDGDCDGLAVDGAGAVWIARIVEGGLARILPDGSLDGVFPVPGGHVTSLCFGGEDRRDLYVTTAAPDGGQAVMKRTQPEQLTGALLRARASTPGLPERCAAFALPG